MVVALQANYLEVELDDPEAGLRLLCTRRTRLAHRGAAVHVGDRVWVEAIDREHNRAVVAEVDPRSSWLTRPPVANVTAVVVALAVEQPAFDPDQASRFLLTAEQTGLQVHVLLSKCDLIPAEQQQALVERLRGWGYDPLAVSSRTGMGLETLRSRLAQGSLSVLCGPSGVGKSSLLNGLIPGLELRVAAVSGRLQRGRHTTRHVELHTLPSGARVADTPGFNRPELPGDVQNLEVLFPELRRRLEDQPCRFRDCLHRGEPGCGIDQDWDRYPLYRRAVEEMLALSRPSRGG
ncbi:ribosome small subunit-dependent GTPase A [Synechococcus sp. BS56D]|jgi:ribosome biogenesis GTPase|uniref:ribosome small subunit-dependent GTPase A n=1 Tax=Synechococcus sp. BS56D TaxID=2055944 RepID=UPI00103E2944|nr:ribosome small subunit-dependent GTPase A [Synechococcus sp. BS56D]TCD59092.1 ribosome small subunit-dependent GTPase A [Synechococcus sp. BS56D]